VGDIAGARISLMSVLGDGLMPIGAIILLLTKHSVGAHSRFYCSVQNLHHVPISTSQTLSPHPRTPAVFNLPHECLSEWR
jgi:hypothetical protein